MSSASPRPQRAARKLATVSRRSFITTVAAGAAATLVAPAIITAQKSDSKIILGEGDHKFEVQHDFVQLPEPLTWQTTHNVAVDSDGLIYVIHEGRENLKDHPSIFVFDPQGTYIRSFGNQFQGGGHGLEVRKEGSPAVPLRHGISAAQAVRQAGHQG